MVVELKQGSIWVEFQGHPHDATGKIDLRDLGNTRFATKICPPGW